eukprot:TRINITY_DN21477_c0_g1_i1.p1 TRINITY_DN21477_c0_g1~~TRINITY_DN21477_c0_g1_i1.p1  ORF type:complete len:233 (-),score=41.06 TRINITY_DN21477_c0_g1_i1:371-1000(-)
MSTHIAEPMAYVAGATATAHAEPAANPLMASSARSESTFAATLQAPLDTKCPSCGNTYMTDAAFCRQCGRRRGEALPLGTASHGRQSADMLPVSPEPSDAVLCSGDWQDQIAYGCRMVQESSAQKIREMERELERLRQESEELRRKGEQLRERNMSLDSELKESKKRNQEQMEENRGVAQMVFSLRAQMGKLGKFRQSLDQACSFVDGK